MQYVIIYIEVMSELVTVDRVDELMSTCAEYERRRYEFAGVSIL